MLEPGESCSLTPNLMLQRELTRKDVETFKRRVIVLSSLEAKCCSDTYLMFYISHGKYVQVMFLPSFKKEKNRNDILHHDFYDN